MSENPHNVRSAAPAATGLTYTLFLCLALRIRSGVDTSLTKPNENGDYVICHDASFSDHCFKAILAFYRDGRIQCPPNVRALIPDPSVPLFAIQKH